MHGADGAGQAHGRCPQPAETLRGQDLREFGFAVAQRRFVSFQRTVESIKFGVGAGCVVPDFNGGFVALSAGNLRLFFGFGNDYGSLFVCLGADLLSLLLSDRKSVV